MYCFGGKCKKKALLAMFFDKVYVLCVRVLSKWDQSVSDPQICAYVYGLKRRTTKKPLPTPTKHAQQPYKERVWSAT